ncbi:hypothetical protein Pcinc_042939 [Petrolisthes cinctipes]|uniref:Valine--tRNA ligase n=1 Tax=Petrolisthes cinctipes TaxID=88211 RepID=A0AAE1BHP4_PETCI|nr:hypothetical protein Pcinc_042939 [Petrolisthes cinctipes]
MSSGEIFTGNYRKMCSKNSTLVPSAKKDLSQPLAQTYQPREVERGWYSWWRSCRFFRRPQLHQGHKFVMVLPPPNVTGSLHLGHALTCSLQDAIARWNQMKGAEVVFVPGCDHAGIATQAVVERHLLATLGKTKHQMGRERFVEEVWKWKEEKGDAIFKQMERLGTALDWNRSVFTMDEGMTEAVNEAFIQLFDQGLVYRKHSPVNWCCSLQSAISDIEVEHVSLPGPSELRVPGYDEPVTFGMMYDLAYKVVDSEAELVVSTTRPETLLGDTALIVHPGDNRYSEFVGKFVYHPFRRQSIPVVADDGVDVHFGTGVIKVTPGHSKEDYEYSQRHKLEQIIVLDDEGRINDIVPEFEGLPRFKAREAVISAMKQLKLFRGSRPHPMMLPLCSRTGDVIEAILKPQWFIQCSQMAKDAIKAVESETLELLPPSHGKQWSEWLECGVDWCVSRQLWWGHRIPAYSCKLSNERQVWVAARSEEEALRKLVQREGVAENTIISIQQDEDVLDTWFCSGLYPFAAFGWPHHTLDLTHYYPTSLLETGHDILFFWVARMVMLGQKLTGQIPFKTVLLHGLMCDVKGHKMSKSRGNVIDPLDIINGTSVEELKGRPQSAGIYSSLTSPDSALTQLPSAKNTKGIPECGADALRFTLCSSNFKNQLLSFDLTKVEQNKFLGNKIWQTVKFLLSATKKMEDSLCLQEESLAHQEMNLNTHVVLSQRDELSLMDRWILSQVSSLVQNANRHFESYDLHLVTLAFTNFWQNCLCDVYLESIKPVLKSGSKPAQISAIQTLLTSVDAGLKVLAPFMPFLTEELYQRLPTQKINVLQNKDSQSPESIMECDYPDPNEWSVWKDQEAEEQGAIILEVATAIRGLKSRHNVSFNNSQGTLVTMDTNMVEMLRKNLDTLKTLSRIRHLEVGTGVTNLSHSAVTTLSHSTSFYLHLQNSVSIDAELSRLRKKEVKLKKELKKFIKNTSSPKYILNTPPKVQEIHREKVTTLSSELSQLETLIENLNKK